MTLARELLCGSRKLCVSHETQFRDLGRVSYAMMAPVWLSTGFSDTFTNTITINFGHLACIQVLALFLS